MLSSLRLLETRPAAVVFVSSFRLEPSASARFWDEEEK